MANITISLSQVAAREVYEIARAPRIVAITLSNETKAELLTALKPVKDEDAPAKAETDPVKTKAAPVKVEETRSFRGKAD